MLAVAVGVFGLTATAVGLAAAVQQLWGVYRKRVPAKISWRKIEQGVEEIIRQLRAANYVPDVIIALGRSGAILGGLIAGNMGNLPLALLDRQFSWDERRREHIQSKFTDVHIGPETQRVLLVVGEVYTGQTLITSLAKLKGALAGKQVQTCSLVISRTAPFRVDYSFLTVDKTVRPAWVIADEYLRFESPLDKTGGV